MKGEKHISQTDFAEYLTEIEITDFQTPDKTSETIKNLPDI